ncbi:hypothetical protein [Actinomadura sp. BRA 177]|uniref:hypothetical protein n=1 Tax=Actinomadura sp. BRA 177 TaxID=2745202 RepID=UPI001596005E|nr:hypothetical protein [Actinomadura sp. BRA 177]NVI92488.1 hypothetical protein [Actinomadura sp. BRA 177]
MANAAATFGLALGLVVLSPLAAESLSGYDSTTGDPLALLGGLLLLGPLYGCPALLIREIAHRLGAGWPGIVALAAAFGVLEAGVVDQSMFALSYREVPYWDDMLRPTLIEPIGMAPYMALSFVGGHIIWSFCAPIALVQALAGRRARLPWLRWRGLTVATVLYLAVAALIWNDHRVNGEDQASTAQVAAALAAVVMLTVMAWAFGLRARPALGERPVPRPWQVGLLGLAGALGFNFLPSTWLGFAGGVALAVAAVGGTVAASRSSRWTRRHVVAMAGGALLAMGISAFFVTPLGDVPPVPKYAHNTVFLLGALALTGWAMRRAGESRHPGAEVSP